MYQTARDKTKAGDTTAERASSKPAAFSENEHLQVKCALQRGLQLAAAVDITRTLP